MYCNEIFVHHLHHICLTQEFVWTMESVGVFPYNKLSKLCEQCMMCHITNPNGNYYWMNTFNCMKCRNEKYNSIEVDQLSSNPCWPNNHSFFMFVFDDCCVFFSFLFSCIVFNLIFWKCKISIWINKYAENDFPCARAKKSPDSDITIELWQKSSTNMKKSAEQKNTHELDEFMAFAYKSN